MRATLIHVLRKIPGPMHIKEAVKRCQLEIGEKHDFYFSFDESVIEKVILAAEVISFNPNSQLIELIPEFRSV